MGDQPSNTPSDPKPEGDPKGEKGQQDPPQQQLGEGGKKALEDERAARKQAESDLKALRGEFDGFKKSLSEAFGVQASKDDGDAIEQVQARLTQMEHESAVYRLAAQHQITEPGDVDLLKSAKDEQAMTKLAERLAAKAEAETKPGTPKPDATQGGAGEPPALNSTGLEDALKSKLGIT